MKIIFMGSGKFAEPTLRYLANSPYEIPMVITQPARGSGRGRKTARTPVAAVADQLGWEVVEMENVNDPAMVDRIRATGARLALVIAFGQKLGDDLIASMPGGCINLHASLLPRYRGAAPINWAVIRGEERSGCTVFRIAQRMDGGPILTSRWTSIKPEETAGELHDRLAGVGVDAVDAALQLYQDGALPQGEPQDDSQATRAPKLKKTDGYIDFNQPAKSVASFICGMTPWPGAVARFEAMDGRWEQVQLLRARPAPVPGTTEPGKTDPDLPDDEPGVIDSRCYIGAADGYVELLEIKPSSGRIMSWKDYVNGRHVEAGDMFTTPSVPRPS